MAYELIWEARGIWRRFHGTLEPADLLASIDEVQRDPRFDDLRYSINDFLDVVNVHDVPGMLEDVLARTIGAAHTNRRIRMAIVTRLGELVARTRDLPEGVMPYPVRLFDSLEDARAWAEGA